MKRLHVLIRGHVQGVFFRSFVASQARALALNGWVRNRLDGTVEWIAEGAPDALDALRALSERGPEGARVSAVDVTEEAVTGEFRTFSIRSSV